ncbi:PREDICTED: heparanase isoform X2 [Nanorana parkeri]|uniref:heparanase isoform X2 n=1 Tax=Nanorana parkeri TaxID=125878 RepID=UPI00085484B6|nr:PREDICTED: heparanase isoform X2 [Nanorana parkeri]
MHFIVCIMLLAGTVCYTSSDTPPENIVELELQLKTSGRPPLNPRFLSVTIDASLASEPKYIAFLGSQRLITLTRGLSPAFLRFGGTKSDFLFFDPAKNSSEKENIFWKKSTNQELIKGGAIPLSVQHKLQALWPTQEQIILKEEFLRKYKNSTITKPNSFKKKSGLYIDGAQLGKDFMSLHQLLSTYLSYKNSGLYGPDIGQPKKQSQRMLTSFLKAGGKVINSVTWHHYYVDGRTASKKDFLNPHVLDSLASEIKTVFQIVNQTVPGKLVWLGETSSAYGGGCPGLSNTYIDGFMWLDKLGMSAKLGIDVVMRQALFGAGSYNLVDSDYEPLPDYWLSLLFKKLVGPVVLNASLKNSKGICKLKIRVFLLWAHKTHPKYRRGDVSVFAMNLCNHTQQIQLPSFLSGKAIDEYLLLPGDGGLFSQTVLLNGEVLRMVDDKTLPTLDGKEKAPGSPLLLPSSSFGFYVVKDAQASACL